MGNIINAFRFGLPVATGGLMYRVGNYIVHAFLSSDNLVVSNGGMVQYFNVAGGGGGGISDYNFTAEAGGGGAGGIEAGAIAVSPGTFPCIIGAGGPGTVFGGSAGTNGNNSSFLGITSIGGGRGASALVRATSGGSGGGEVTGHNGSAGTPGEGNKGGDSLAYDPLMQVNSGGGGGASSAGSDGLNGSVDTPGGLPLTSLIKGYASSFCSGGYGAKTTLPFDGNLNSGNGGSGANSRLASTGGTGGSGSCYVRYRNPTLAVDILDQYPAAQLGISFRTLNSAYTGPCIRIRRSSDNAEMDIYFIDHYLDTSTLLSFVGAGDGYMVKWYDQSGSSNDLFQTTAANQWKLISAGAFTYNNGKIGLPMLGTGKYFNLTTAFGLSDYWCVQVGKRNSSGVSSSFLTDNGLTTNTITWYVTDLIQVIGSTIYKQYGPVNPPFSGQYIIMGGADNTGAPGTALVNGQIPPVDSGGPVPNNFVTKTVSTVPGLDDVLQEQVIWSNAVSINQQKISSLYNLYYNVF